MSEKHSTIGELKNNPSERKTLGTRRRRNEKPIMSAKEALKPKKETHSNSKRSDRER